MEVQLYVYDLSQGLARQVSRQLLGTQIDAVYHTSLVFNGVEYFFGRGVQTCYPGRTHHGRPMEIIKLGKSSLPEDVIAEYLDSLREVYTAESYDLFMHNCNNFTHDFATFLVGKGIPEHITSLPRTVLNTPFGQMLRPQLDSAMRGVTQADVPPQAIPPRKYASTNGQHPTDSSDSGFLPNGNRPVEPSTHNHGKVHKVTSLKELNTLLESAKLSCATIFFTSSTCAPCKLAYPTFDDLAAEHAQRCTLIKVDINTTRDVAMNYSIRATPTFMTYLKGEKDTEWTGADPGTLRANVDALVRSAFPPHPHMMLKLQTFLGQSRKAIIYAKVPPLEKLRAKMGDAGKHPAVDNVIDFINTRSNAGPREAPLPDLSSFSIFLRTSIQQLPVENLFAAYDLLRLVLVDPRATAFFAQEKDNTTLFTLFNHVNYTLASSCPYNLRLVSLHLACNLFTSSVFTASPALNSTSNALVSLASHTLLHASEDEGLTSQNRNSLIVAAACLALNIATVVFEQRSPDENTATISQQITISQDTRVELAAALIEFLSSCTSTSLSETGGSSSPQPPAEAVKAAVLAMGRLVYFGDVACGQDSEVVDLCRAMDAAGAVASVRKVAEQEDKGEGARVVDEVAKELLGKGLAVLDKK